MGPRRTEDRVSVEDLAGRFSRGERLVLLDVREPAERTVATIVPPPDVRELHVPVREIPLRLDAIRGESAGPVVVYCHHGARSQMVCEWLRAQGVAGLLNLDGGIDAWSRRVDPGVARY